MSKKNRKQGETHISDTSPKVTQRDKIKDLLTIKDLNWTEKQKEFIRVSLDKNTKMVIADGLPGTGKSLLATYCSLTLINQKKLSDLVYIRSLIQAKDGETGFLQGNLEEKTMYYNIPLMDKLRELLPLGQINSLIKEERIVCYPTSMLRGYNFAAEAVIVDEAQNLLFDSILTAMTRMGEFSKLFLLGDTIYQNDLGKHSGFRKVCEIFNTEDCRKNGVFYFNFGKEDILRSGFVRFVMEKIEAHENKIITALKKETMFP